MWEKSCKSQIWHGIGILIAFLMMFSLVNTRLVNADSQNPENIKESSVIEISQGESTHHFIGMNKQFSFELSLKEAPLNSHYHWQILFPPEHGQASLSTGDEKIQVFYLPDEGFIGKDIIQVQVSSGHNEVDTISIHITITPDAEVSEHLLPEVSVSANLDYHQDEPPSSPFEELIPPSNRDIYPRLPRQNNDPNGLGNEILPQIEGASFYVRPNDDEIYGFNWPDSTAITLSIGSQTWTETSESDGSVYFSPEVDIIPGQLITMSGGGFTKEHTVIDLKYTSYDEEADTLSGIADPGELEVYGQDGYSGETVKPTANENGLWTATFPTVEIRPGTTGSMQQYDLDGDSTYIDRWYIPDPYFDAYPLSDQLYGYDWSPNATVTLTIDAYTWTIQSSSSGWFYLSLYPFDITPGQTLVMTDGTYTRTHTVKNLAMTAYDEDLETVSGTADVNGIFEMYGEDGTNFERLYPTIESSGNWTAQFTSVDIAPGTDGYLIQYDDEGNRTCVSWYVPDPYLYVYPLSDQVNGSEWSPNTSVTLTIGSQTWTEQSNSSGNVSFSVSPFDIVPLQTLEMADGTSVRTHVVKNLAMTSYDEDLETVSGTADVIGRFEMYADDDTESEWLSPTVDSSGNWTAQFIDVDIAPGTDGYLYQYDDEGNSTRVRWYIPDPYMYVYPLYDQVEGYNWSPNTLVTLTIGTQSWTEQSNSSGQANFFIQPFDIIPGQSLAMTDGTYTRTHVVKNLAMTSYDEDLEIVSGIAEVNGEFEMYGEDSNLTEWLSPPINSSGNWTAQFTNVDIAPGTDGYLIQYDDQGNSTRVHWYIPDPYFQVYKEGDYIYGWEWPVNTNITLTIDDVGFGTALSNETGRVYFGVDHDFQVGEVVKLNAGSLTRTHIVKNIAVINVDLEGDALSGTADVGPLTVSAYDGDDWFYKYPTTNTAGEWSVSFAGSVDIKPGTYGWAYQYDDEGNSTNYRWVVINPYFYVYHLENQIYGNDWSPNTTVTLTIGSQTWAVQSDSGGWFRLYLPSFDILPGQTLVVTDGTHTRTHVVRDLSVTDINIDTDTLTGTADPGELEVIARSGGSWYYRYPVADAEGAWTANFYGTIDINQDSYGYLYQYDAEDNYTVVYWYIPNPYFYVYHLDNQVYGYEWSPNTTITLTIGSQTWTVQSDYDGWFRLNLPSFDILPGQTLVVTDDKYTRTHVVKDLSVTDINFETDTLTGTADPGELRVRAYAIPNVYDLLPVADSEGNWTANFSGSPDITQASYGYLYQYDAEGNYTVVYWYTPDPYFVVYPQFDEVYGSGWPANSLVILKINEVSISSASTDSRGMVLFMLESFDVLPGQIVELSDPTYTKQHTVINLTLTAYDLELDTLVGTASANKDLIVEVYDIDDSGYVNNYQSLFLTVDSSGNWTADFSKLFDIKPGSTGSLVQEDEDGDTTYLSWNIPLENSIFLPLILR